MILSTKSNPGRPVETQEVANPIVPIQLPQKYWYELLKLPSQNVYILTEVPLITIPIDETTTVSKNLSYIKNP